MYLRLLSSASGPCAGLPGPVLGGIWPESLRERTYIRSQTSQAEDRSLAPSHQLYCPNWLKLALEARPGDRKHY